jgi:stalled ribosome alternative rescue factor ArfA
MEKMYKETKILRKIRVNNSIKTYTKIMKPKKGKGSYDRSKNKNIQQYMG